ncbi:MAG TPA: TlpA disulfide reductase family protein [Gammaproteobacteria bacterium]
MTALEKAAWPPLFRALAVLVVISTSALTGYFAHDLLTGKRQSAASIAPPPAMPAATADLVGTRRPPFLLPDYLGNTRDVSEWDGRLLVLNFWATWCPPCLHEIPVFISLQAEYAERGLQFVGVAIDERDNVRDYADDVGLNYPSIQHPTATLDLLRTYGNRQGGLPYTVMVGSDGRILFTRLGPLTGEEARALIEKHLPG